MVMWVWLSYQTSCLQNFDIDIYRYCRLSIKISVDSIYRPSLWSAVEDKNRNIDTAVIKWCGDARSASPH